jgi:general stress protein YciG
MKTDISKYMAEIGRKGGQAKGHSKVRGTAEYYKSISQIAAAARKSKLPYAADETKTHRD